MSLLGTSPAIFSLTKSTGAEDSIGPSALRLPTYWAINWQLMVLQGCENAHILWHSNFMNISRLELMPFYCSTRWHRCVWWVAAGIEYSKVKLPKKTSVGTHATWAISKQNKEWNLDERSTVTPEYNQDCIHSHRLPGTNYSNPLYIYNRVLYRGPFLIPLRI